MYSIIRKIHLYTAFVIAAFLLMYFVTGGVMVFESLFPRANKKTTIETLAIERSGSDEKIIKDVCSKFSVHGELRVNSSDGNKVYRFSRPGYKAELSRVHADSIRVTIREGTFGSVMNDFHRLRGYEGSWTHIVWAFLYDLSCISLLVFALTGIFLWWKSEKNKALGVVFLLLSTGITAFTITYFYWVG